MIQSLIPRTRRAVTRSGSKLAGQARRFGRHNGGVAAIEFAFIFPLMLLIYIGLVNLTEGLSANRKINLAASTIADLVTQESGTTTMASLDAFFNATKSIIDPLNDNLVRIELFGYTVSGSSPTLKWLYNNGKGPSCGATPTPDASMTQLMSNGNDVVVARACYNYSWLKSYTLDNAPFDTGSFLLEEDLTLRPRQSLTLDCSDCPTS